MKKQICNIAWGVILMGSALAIPGYSETVLSFSGNETGGSVLVNGSNFVTAIADVPYNFFDVFVPGTSNTPYFDLSATLNLINSGTVLELDGEIPSLGINSEIALVDITLSSPLINAGGANPLNIAIPTTTSVTESAALLDALGIPEGLTSSLGNSGLIGQFTGIDPTTGFNAYDVTSDTLAVDLTVPEPGTLPMLGISLLSIAFYFRKKIFQLQ